MQEGESGRFTSFDGTGIAFDRWPGERGPIVPRKAGAEALESEGDHLGAVGEPALAQTKTDFLEESP